MIVARIRRGIVALAALALLGALSGPAASAGEGCGNFPDTHINKQSASWLACSLHSASAVIAGDVTGTRGELTHRDAHSPCEDAVAARYTAFFNDASVEAQANMQLATEAKIEGGATKLIIDKLAANYPAAPKRDLRQAADETDAAGSAWSSAASDLTRIWNRITRGDCSSESDLFTAITQAGQTAQHAQRKAIQLIDSVLRAKSA